MEENQKKAFDFAADLTKQLITLSTAVITLSVTFSKDIIGISKGWRLYLLIGIWGLYFLSILFGLLTLMSLTGNLDPIPTRTKSNDGNIKTEKPNPILTITSHNIISTSKWQVWTFLIALLLTCFYGFNSVSVDKNVKDDLKKDGYMIIRKSQLGSDTTTYFDTLYLPYKK